MPDDDAGLRGGVATVVSPGAYAVSDGGGDITGFGGQGLFYRDVRHLSRYVLAVGGRSPVWEGATTRGAVAEFVSSVSGVGVSRRREVGGGMAERIELSDLSGEGGEFGVSLECAADFRDVFEVRGICGASGRGRVVEEAGKGLLRFCYRRGGFSRATVVSVSGDVAPAAEPGRITFSCRLGPGESRAFGVKVTLEDGGREVRLRGDTPLFGEVPRLETDWGLLREVWERGVLDLEALSFEVGEGLRVPAAGAPWFMALFGRDSLITGYEVMALSAEPAKNTLRALARWQSGVRDDFTDAEPGKMLHELRAGELAHFGEIPQSPYYGTVDATPLFLVLLEEVWRWTGDDAFVRELEGAARKAVAWILFEADRVRGHIAYETRSAAGLVNHCWKDSDASVLFRDGTRAGGPIAVCEVQGYAYDALLRTARLSERVWGDRGLAGDLRRRARDLRSRFDNDFWMPERGCYALALDGEGRRVDSVTSNVGHLLWSGIVPRERARRVVDHLMGDAMFSGWGIRTMAEGEGGYDPDSYHNGSVWPHDNALICMGLQRYGFREEAARVASAILDAAPHFDHRLPEVFAGYRRREGDAPVPYPTSCSPQAWAAGATPLLARAVLGTGPLPEGAERGVPGRGIRAPRELFSEARRTDS